MARNSLPGGEAGAFISPEKVTAFATGRNPGLDMLRALAALAVFFYHFRLFEQGWLGVQVFFVISGYLITQSIESRPGEPRQRIVSFYGRRIRRIVPPLYIYLLLIALPYVVLMYPKLMKSWVAALTFTYNIYHVLPDMQYSRMLTHTWSLGVEEQFYLVFPFLMVLWRRNATLVLLLVVATAPLIRWEFMQWLGRSDERNGLAVYVVGFTQLDSFAIGALFCLHRYKVKRFASWGSIALVLAAMVALGWATKGWPDGALWFAYLEGAQAVWGYSLMALFSGLLVVRLSWLEGEGLGVRWLAWLGFYSYEFYILHFPLLNGLLRIFPDTLAGKIGSVLVGFPILVVMSVGLHRASLLVLTLLRQQPRPGPAG